MTVDFYIYQHRRLTDGKVFYVGKGHKGRAWEQESRSEYWKRVVQKHGYYVEVVQDGLQSWYALELEIEAIARYRESGSPLVNLTDGGEGTAGYRYSDEQKQVSKLTAKRRWACDDFREKVSEAARAATLRNLEDPEFREARAAKWRESSDLEARSKQLADRNAATWADPVEAERLKHAISSSWANPETKAKRVAGIKLAYATTDFKKRNADHLRAVAANPELREKRMQGVRKKMTPVVCAETGVVYESLSSAARHLSENGHPSASGGNLRLVCIGKLKTAYGFHWKYASKGGDFVVS